MADPHPDRIPSPTPDGRSMKDDIDLIRELAQSGVSLRELSETLKAVHRPFDGTDIH